MRRARYVVSPAVAACLALGAWLFASSAALEAQAAAWTVDPLALQDELGAIEKLIARGAEVSESDVAAAESIRDRAEAGAARSLRTRSAVVAYLARESRANALAAARAEEGVRAAIAGERLRRQAGGRLTARFIGFRVSLGACALFVGAYDVLGLLGEAAYARFARASTPLEAEAALRQARAYGVATTAAVGVLAVAIGALLATAGGATTSPP